MIDTQPHFWPIAVKHVEFAGAYSHIIIIITIIIIIIIIATIITHHHHSHHHHYHHYPATTFTSSLPCNYSHIITTLQLLSHQHYPATTLTSSLPCNYSQMRTWMWYVPASLTTAKAVGALVTPPPRKEHP